MQPTLILKPQREKSLRNHHPWIFSGAVGRIEGSPQSGDTVDILAADGRWLARGGFSPASQIRARVWSFARDEAVDAAFFQRRLARAVALRRPILADGATTACRLVWAESDGVPGLILDRYDRWLVVQFLTAASERWKGAVVDALQHLLPGMEGVLERSDVDVRRKEGLTMSSGLLVGQAPPGRVEIRENGCRYRVDLVGGHKTGFYLDQRDNRARLAAYAKDADVLNSFAYTGGFAVAALRAGARHVVNVDTSAAALDLARENITLNDLDPGMAEQVNDDVFQRLRRYQNEARRFDLIVLDPPKFVQSKGDLMRASRGYKDINRLAFALLAPEGTLFTFSCSGLLGRDLFQKIVADAALDAGRQAVVLHWLTQSADHPTALNFPEGNYLKGLVCRV